MNAIMNETHFWFCDICDESININSKSKHYISKTHTHKKYGTVVKEYEFIRPEVDIVNYILNDTFKGCKNKYFHSLEYKYVYDIEYISMENTEEVILKIFVGYVKFNSQFYETNEKIKNALKKGLDLVKY